MEQFILTDDEKDFIVKRRELADKRKKLQANAAQKTPVAQPKPKSNRPPGWDDHCDVHKTHKGRMTEEHPLYWFEKEIFSKITNLQHKAQHKKITEILHVPVQNVFRDRCYHAIQHLQVLWEQCMLPLKYKARIEDFKAKHNIGMDGVHPEHKKQKPDYKYPVPVTSRPWDNESYGEADDNEEFIVGKQYVYEYDNICGYEYKDVV